MFMLLLFMLNLINEPEVKMIPIQRLQHIDKIIIDSLRNIELQEGAYSHLLIGTSPEMFENKIINELLDEKDSFRIASNTYIQEAVKFLVSFYKDYYTVRMITEKYCFKKIRIKKNLLDLENIEQLGLRVNERCIDHFYLPPIDYFSFMLINKDYGIHFGTDIYKQSNYCDNYELSKLRFERAKKIYSQLLNLIDQLTVVDFPYNRYQYELRNEIKIKKKD